MIRADDRERLSADCARLSAEGLSLRAIGERMGFSYETARALIAERQTQTGVRGPHPARPPARSAAGTRTSGAAPLRATKVAA